MKTARRTASMTMALRVDELAKLDGRPVDHAHPARQGAESLRLQREDDRHRLARLRRVEEIDEAVGGGFDAVRLGQDVLDLGPFQILAVDPQAKPAVTARRGNGFNPKGGV